MESTQLEQLRERLLALSERISCQDELSYQQSGSHVSNSVYLKEEVKKHGCREGIDGNNDLPSTITDHSSEDDNLSALVEPKKLEKESPIASGSRVKNCLFQSREEAEKHKYGKGIDWSIYSSDDDNLSALEEPKELEKKSPIASGSRMKDWLFQRREEAEKHKYGKGIDWSIDLSDDDNLSVLEESKELEKELPIAIGPRQKHFFHLMEEAKMYNYREGIVWYSNHSPSTTIDNSSEDDNPSALEKRKKLKQKDLFDMNRGELEIRNRLKRKKNMMEFEKIKRRRQEREFYGKRNWKEDLGRTKLVREKHDIRWERRARQLDLEQIKSKSRIRFQEGHAKPIDILARYIHAEKEELKVDNTEEMYDPYMYMQELGIVDLEELIEDVKVYKDLDRDKNLEYWNMVAEVAQVELQKFRKTERMEYQADICGTNEIKESADEVRWEDVTTFKDKTTTQLESLWTQIQEKVKGMMEEVRYWESILSELNTHIASARLRDQHEGNLHQTLPILMAEQDVAGAEIEVESSQMQKNESSDQENFT